MGMGMGVNPYPLVYMGDPMGLFLCRGYGYGVVIPGGYLPIAISTETSIFSTAAAERRLPYPVARSVPNVESPTHLAQPRVALGCPLHSCIGFSRPPGPSTF